VLRGGKSNGRAAHWQPVLRMYITPFSTARTSIVRLLPPPFASGINGPMIALKAVPSTLVGQITRVAQLAAVVFWSVLGRPHGRSFSGNRRREPITTDSDKSVCSRTDTKKSVRTS
jgi:hypothetical protein